jgi:hypothetical protein
MTRRRISWIPFLALTVSTVVFVWNAWAAPVDTPGESNTPALDARESGKPNIVVYMVDTLRARELGCYGAEVTQTPALDAFAAKSALFEYARTLSSWTRPSVASLLTGVAPDVHGINVREDVLVDVDSSLARLPKLLQEQGYYTGAIIANPQVDSIPMTRTLHRLPMIPCTTHAILSARKKATKNSGKFLAACWMHEPLQDCSRLTAERSHTPMLRLAISSPG